MTRRSTWRITGLSLLAAAALVLIAARQAANDDYGYGEPSGATSMPAVAHDDAGLAKLASGRSIHINLWHTPDPGEYLQYNQRERLIQRGKLVYDKYCGGCHGDQGDGQGPAAQRLITPPRDFTRGIYKFRSTDSSSLPTDADLHRTITRGLSRVSMPAFPLMPEHDKVAVIQYIKHFYPRWDAEAPQRKIVPVPHAPPDLDDPQRLLRGHIVYLAMQCNKCHGTDGAGAGATETQYVDAWGHPQRAFNFTRGKLKGGDDPEDIYRTFHTGLRSIMPAYGVTTLASTNRQSFDTQRMFLSADEAAALEPALDQFPATGAEVFTKMSESDRLQLGERNSWDLVAYVMSLRQDTSTRAAVLGDPPPPETPPDSPPDQRPDAPTSQP
jgi:mono/diheme cytochrome c family protein